MNARTRTRWLWSSLPSGATQSASTRVVAPFLARPRMSEAARGLISVAAVVVVLAISLVASRQFRIVPSVAIVLVIASLFLSLRWMIALVVLGFGCVGVDVAAAGWDEALLSAGVVLGLIAVSFVGLVNAFRRQAAGLGPIRAETVIEQLRAQLLIQGAIPTLPAGWHVDVEQRAAFGVAIAGDFVSSRLHEVGGNLHLDLVLVDVSGKGVEAGTRALLLSGAMGGLLGSVGPEEFLTEANDYLRRQAWAEGFASAVYVRVNFDTGLYSIRSAGHPPALHMDVNAKTWRISDSKGTLLGVLPKITSRADYRTMRPGDALLVYTDGVVEDPGQDLELGTDRLMVAAERLVRTGETDQVARRLVEQVPTRIDDDRAVVLIWRDKNR